jgi:hypothetical protein
MRALEEFASNPNVRPTVERYSRSPIVQGIVVEVDEIWWRLWSARNQGLDVRRYFEWVFYGPLPRRYPFWIDAWSATTRQIDQVDFGWAPPGWAEFCRENGRPERPFWMTVCLTPQTSSEDHSEAQSLRNDKPPFVRIETRPRAFLRAGTVGADLAKGLQIRCGSAMGTLGGVVRALDGKQYGITCSHVCGTEEPVRVDMPRRGFAKLASGVRAAFVEDAPWPVLGRCTRKSELVVCSPDVRCDAFSDNPPSSNLNRVDAALIEVPATIELADGRSINRIAPRSAISPRQSMWLHGGAAGVRECVATGFAPFYKIRDRNRGTEHCFEKLIQFNAPEPEIANTGYMHPVNDGDSGSWLTIPNESSNSWYAMTIGSDAYHAFAVSADVVTAWAASVGVVLDLGTASSARVRAPAMAG